MKRVLSLLIAVIMVFSMMPAMTFMSLAETVPAADAKPMGEAGKVSVFTDGVDSTWHTVNDYTPVQVVGTNGVYNGKYNSVYSNTGVIGFLLEFAGVQSPVTLTTNSFMAGVTNNTNATKPTTWQVWDSWAESGGYTKKTAGGDAIDADGVYMYVAQPQWWSQWGGMIYCYEINDISFVTSATCSMRVLGAVEIPRNSDAYTPDFTSEITYVGADDKTTVLGTQSSTISTGWGNDWGGSLVKKVDPLLSDYEPAPSTDDTQKYEFNGWKTVDTDASVTCAAGQFTVYPTMKANSLDAVKVTFKNESAVLDTQTVDMGATVSYAGPAPVKSDDEETTYLFRGWKDEAGNPVDLATYTAQTDATLTAEFTAAKKTKAALIEKEAAGFNKTGTYGIKLNRNDITLSDGTAAPITGGTVTVSSQHFTNEKGEKKFTVTFDSIDEQGVTNAEIKLVPNAGCSGLFTVDFGGSVSGADGASARIFKTTESISTIDDQQAGKYYGESAEAKPLNKTVVGEDGTVKAPAEQTLWKDNVDFGSAYPSITYVMKATGIKDPVILSNISNLYLTDTKSDYYFHWTWFYGNPFWGGAKEPSRYMKISEDGYYLLYYNNRILNNNISGAKELYIFRDNGENPVSEGSSENTVKTNTNENAAIQMIAVVGGDLQPVITFRNEDGSVYGTPYRHKYTDVGNEYIGDGNLTKQTMKLITVGDAIDAAAVQTPVKASDENYNYTFVGWATDKEGTQQVDLNAPLYMSTDLYPIFEKHDKSVTYPVTFMNDGTQYGEEQQVSEGSYATAPADPTKDEDATGRFNFAGWSLTEGGEVVNLADVAIFEPTTFYAVYTHEDVTFTVKYMDGDAEVKTETVVRSKPATPPEMKNKYDEYDLYDLTKNEGKNYYVFKQWVDEKGVVFDKDNVTSDVTVTAEYETKLIEKWCHVYWRNENDEHIWSAYAAYGDYPVNPSLSWFEISKFPKHNTGDENYWYTLKDWDDNSKKEVVEDGTIIYPAYEKTPITPGDMPYQTEKVAGNVGEKNVLWNEETTLDKAYNGVTVMLRVTDGTPVRIGGVFAEADGSNSITWAMRHCCGDKEKPDETPDSEQEGLIRDVTDNKWHYITLGANVISYSAENRVMKYFALDDQTGWTCAPSTGTGSYEAYMFMGGYHPIVRFYSADKKWLQTQRYAYDYGNTKAARGLVKTPEELYNGTLPEGFLYWADAEGNRVTEVLENMDLYAVLKNETENATVNYDSLGFTVGNTLALNVNLTCNELEETYTMCDTWTMYLDAETETGVWTNIDSKTVDSAANATFNLTGIPAAYISSNLRVRFEGNGKFGAPYKSQKDTMELNGAEVPITFVNYSVKAKGQEPENGKLKNLLNSMLNYAASVQNYKKFNTENLANKDLTPEEQNVKSIADSDYDWTPYAALKRGITSYENKAVKIKSSQLLLGTDKVGFRFHFNAQGEDVSTLIAKVKYTENGNTVEKEISAFTVVSEANGDYYATFEGLDPTSFSTQVEVSVYRNGEKVSNTAYDSIPQMAHQVAKDDKHVNMRPVLSTLLVYSNEAQNYVAQ